MGLELFFICCFCFVVFLVARGGSAAFGTGVGTFLALAFVGTLVVIPLIMFLVVILPIVIGVGIPLLLVAGISLTLLRLFGAVRSDTRS